MKYAEYSSCYIYALGWYLRRHVTIHKFNYITHKLQVRIHLEVNPNAKVNVYPGGERSGQKLAHRYKLT